ncbi:MAG: 6-carboxytetrahydropterin synthase QueD [Bacteroidales bacterium]|nr:6-carboxytetrahydropterin synthase QueD [Clostridium sp.]MCM1202946.1 6-carboxytetrahydropterin synthase QueD [Bacteroidales bacterium]
MYTLQTSANFDSAHFLKGYEGKCRNIHGHRWLIEATVAAEQLEKDGQNRGMVVDFKTLREDLNRLAEELDHSLVIEEESIREKTKEALLEEGFRIVEVPFRPTAENLAKYFYDELEEREYQVILVKVYETPNNCAGYSR